MNRLEKLKREATKLHIVRTFKDEAEKNVTMARYTTAYKLGVSLQEVNEAIGRNAA